ncbi:MAG: DHA2 family efflux MFS transporter permease subunit [Candidatus Eremiobacteraeota bacterium]|nr:DHA2 family efflux MFS transporter permease subunit [Candidatus Eremiobacteraeota bacterium]
MAAVGPSPEAQAWRPKHNPWLIAIAVMSATFMEILDTSIANVALPHIAGSMASTAEEATWAITSYLVANAIVLPLTGWLAVNFGRKRFLVTCIILFTFASVLSGAATSLTMLIVARILQGLGGGAMQPTAQAVLLESFPPRQRGAAMAFYGVGVVVAPILGPIVGGFITDNYTWRWSFYINLPVGMIAILMALLFIEDPPFLAHRAGSKVDYPGFFSLALWIAALQIMLDKGQQEGWFQSSLIVTLAVIFAIALMFFLNWELQTGAPVVELSILKDRNFAIATFLITVVGAVLYGSVTVLPLFLQNLVGYPAFDAGLAVAPRGAGALCAMLMVGPMLARFDGRYFVGFGFFLLGLSNIFLSHINLDISIWNVTSANIVQGVGIGFIFVPLTTLANAYLPMERFSMASGIYNLMRNLGGGIGIALSTTAIARGAQRFQNYLVEHITPYDPTYQNFHQTLSAVMPNPQAADALTYATVSQQAALLAYINIYAIMAWACFLCIPLVFLLRKAEVDGPVAPAH